MGSRAQHNWKRRAKLIQKHTGKEYDPFKRRGKGGGKAKKSKGDVGHWKASSDNWGDEWRGNVKQKASWNSKKQAASPARQDPKKESGRVPSSKLNSPLEDARLLALGESVKPKGRKLKAKRKSVEQEHFGAVEVDLKRKGKVASKLKNVKKVKGKKGDAQCSGTVKKKKKEKTPKETLANAKGATAEVGEHRKLTRKQLKKQWARERKRLRHTAYVVCPGSVTDRYARGGQAHAALFLPLNSYERKLLVTGGLSWRWLREEFDFDDLPPRPEPPQTDAKGHYVALREQTHGMSAAVTAKLRQMDERLGSDALWPCCPARVTLALKLLDKRTLQRRCERHFQQVLAPLFDDVSPSSSSAASSPGAAAPLLAEAYELCKRCAAEWLRTQGEGAPAPGKELDTTAVRRAWMQMLRRALSQADSSPSSSQRWWLCALRSLLLARFCPWPDADAQLQMLRNVSLFAARGRDPDVCPTAIATVCVLPLGIFTPAQALLLVAAARRLGSEATVVRRSAAGPAQVLFRSADVPSAVEESSEH